MTTSVITHRVITHLVITHQVITHLVITHRPVLTVGEPVAFVDELESEGDGLLVLRRRRLMSDGYISATVSLS